MIPSAATAGARVLGAILGAVVALGVVGAGAQEGPEAGPLPSGDGEIRVRVTRPGGAAAGGLDVVLYALPPDGEPGLARAVSDEAGAAVFPGVAADPEIAYLVGVRADDVPYGQRVSFAAGSKLSEVALEVALTDSDGTLARPGPLLIRVDRGCDTLEVTESHPVHNDTDRVVFVSPDQRKDRAPIFERQLPLQAGPLRSALGPLPQGVERDGRTLRFWGPVYPGSQEVDLSYGLPADRAASFRWGFPRAGADVSWLVPAEGGAVEAEELLPAPDREIDGVRYRALRGASLAAGAEIDVTVRLEPPAVPPLRIAEARVFIDLDDALLQADERIQLEVPGDAPLGPGPGPALCLPLPPGAEDIRFDPATLAMAPGLSSTGVLGFRGPIPAGESTVGVGYRLPLTGGPAVFTRRFPVDVTLVEIFVVDRGVRPRTERLHRLRPVRSGNSNYLHLQGFALAGGEELRVALEPLPARRGLPRLAAVGFGLLAAAGTFAFLLGPLQSARSDPVEESGPGDELAAQREAVYAVIRDLDEDFETGKLSPEDHASMRAEMRERAVDLLRQERAAAERAAAPEAAAPAGSETAEAVSCGACGGSLPEKARFCPQCGEPTGAGAA